MEKRKLKNNASQRLMLLSRVIVSTVLYSLSAAVIASSAPAKKTTMTAPALYHQHCAACHGASLKGQPGIPALSGNDLAWGKALESIAQTIRHGIRAPGHPPSRTGIMPAFKTNAAEMSDEEINDLVEYVLSLRGEPVDTLAALRGKENFSWCIDCHGKEARGITAIGGSSLLRKRLQYGATRSNIFQSIALGRAGVCPPWVEVLDEVSIKRLASYLARQ